MKLNIIIFGNGNHAKIIFDELGKLKKYNFLGYVDKKNVIFYKKKKYNFFDFYEKYQKKKIRGIIAVGDNKLRNKISRDIEEIIPKFKWETLISKSAIVSKKTNIGQGTMIISGSVINTNTIIGEHCLINTKSTLDHDNNWGDFTSCGPGVNSAGNVTVKNFTQIGIGSTIIDNILIGKNTVIGAHSLVNKNCKSNSVYFGVPAKYKRKNLRLIKKAPQRNVKKK